MSCGRSWTTFLLWQGVSLKHVARLIPEKRRYAAGMCVGFHCFMDIDPDFSLQQRCYLFNRPLKEAEWNTLRGYTCRVRTIRGFETTFGCILEDTMREVFALAPFADPLFPHLRSLCWRDVAAFAPLHVAVPSLTVLELDLTYFPHLPVPTEFIDAFGDNCPRIERLNVRIDFTGLVDSAISRQIRRWTKLQKVSCRNIALSVDAILHLSSMVNLKQLSCTAGIDIVQGIIHLGSMLVFPSLEDLVIESQSLDAVTSLLHRIRLPMIESLGVTISNYLSRRAIQAYWAAAREACPSAVSIHLCMFTFNGGHEDLLLPGEDVHPELTLEDLRPWTAFSGLRNIYVNLDWHVDLTDTDLLELVSPRMEEVIINYALGWGTRINDGGITLSGLVQLLRQCPSLRELCLAIDTRTFTEIPEGLDASFPPRTRLQLNFVDSHIEPEFVSGIVSVFMALGLDSSMIRAWEIYGGDSVGTPQAAFIWDQVLDELKV